MVTRGATVVLGVGFAQADAMDKVAAEFPDTKFAIIDVNWLDRPNLRQYAFKEHEGSFLVGMAAALASETDKAGFIAHGHPAHSGVRLRLRARCEACQCRCRSSPEHDCTTPAAGNDPQGAELAQSQIDRGADVIYQAAGGTWIGVIRAAADAGKFAIGVDSNQNHLAPGTVLTMLKRVDVAAYETFKDAMSGDFDTGVRILGLAEGGVGWALDEHNASLISDAMKSQIDGGADIVAGKIQVHDYCSDNACPM